MPVKLLRPNNATPTSGSTSAWNALNLAWAESFGLPHHHKHARHVFQRIGLAPVLAQATGEVAIEGLRVGQ